MKGRVLIIAGSDPSGGAGVQADIKTVTALGGYAATAITALTVQNTTGVSAVHAVAPEIIAAQIDAVLSDIGADAIKIGMIGDAETAELLAVKLAAIAHSIPVILDPVLVATSGDALASDGVDRIIREQLIGVSDVVTPNTEEASALTGIVVHNLDDMARAGDAIVNLGAKYALVKGGHLRGEKVVDLLVGQGATNSFAHPRIKTRPTHGTGCTLAAALATGIAQGMGIVAAVQRATDYVHAAIKSAPGFGAGAGPLNHAVRLPD